MSGHEAAVNRTESVTDHLRASVLSEDLNFLLARANALSLSAAHSALLPFELRVRSYSILALVTHDRRPSQRVLAEYLRLDPSQVVSLIDDLQKRGLVRREPDPSDRRTNVVVATERGETVFIDAQTAVRSAEENLHRELMPHQRDQLTELLRLLAFPG